MGYAHLPSRVWTDSRGGCPADSQVSATWCPGRTMVPSPPSDSTPAPLPSWPPARPGKEGRKEERICACWKMHIALGPASASVGRTTTRVLLQWGFFHPERGQSARGREKAGRGLRGPQSLLALERWRL